jgi:hypothetical protein
MEPEGSLPHSQEPATCPYLEQVNNNTKGKYRTVVFPWQQWLSERATMLRYTYTAYLVVF